MAAYCRDRQTPGTPTLIQLHSSFNIHKAYTNKDVPLEIFVISKYYSLREEPIPKRFHKVLKRFTDIDLSFVPSTPEELTDMFSKQSYNKDDCTNPEYVTFGQLIESYENHTHKEHGYLPYRTKTDRSILRYNLAILLKTFSKEQIFTAVPAETKCAATIDRVTFINLTLMCILVPESIRSVYRAYFANCLNCFIARAKAYSDKLKTLTDTGSDEIFQLKNMLVEAVSLTGFRNSPFPGYDPETDLRELAESGQHVHGLLLTKQTEGTKATKQRAVPPGFTKMFDHFLGRIPDPETTQKTYYSLEEWVVKGKWMRAGASDIGHVQVHYDGKRYRFKSRKNTLYMVMTPHELYVMIRDAPPTQVGTNVEKNEFGKIRTAILMDLVTYIRQSYVFSFSPNWYENGPDMTFHHSVSDEIEDKVHMGELFAEGSYGMAFDFKGYDHQLTHGEKIMMTQAIHKRIREMTRDDPHLTEKLACMKWVEDSYENIRLQVVEQGKVKSTFEMVGGLASGEKYTTISGSLYSMCAHSWAAELGGTKPQLLATKGDDTKFVARTSSQCVMQLLTVSALGWVSGKGKFGILDRGMEYLRMATRREVSGGYLARALPSLVQHRPWQQDAPSPAQLIDTIAQQYQTCELRGANWPVTKEHFLQRFRPDLATLLDIPASLGGLGVLPWKGARVVTGETNSTAVTPDQMTVKMPRALDHHRDMHLNAVFPSKAADKLLSGMEHHEKEKAYASAAKRNLTLDDVPKMRGRIRGKVEEEYQARARKTRTNRYSMDPAFLITTPPAALTPMEPMRPDKLMCYLAEGVGLSTAPDGTSKPIYGFGSQKHMGERLSQLRELSRSLDKPLTSREVVDAALTQDERRARTRLIRRVGLSASQAEDYLQGKITPPSYIPSKMIPLLAPLVAYSITKWLMQDHSQLDKVYTSQLYSYLTTNAYSSFYETWKPDLQNIIAL